MTGVIAVTSASEAKLTQIAAAKPSRMYMGSALYLAALLCRRGHRKITRNHRRAFQHGNLSLPQLAPPKLTGPIERPSDQRTKHDA